MIPGATYRIQFRNGMTFDRVIPLIPYLHQLGITHLYASPVFTAAAESTHGYDVINPQEIDPVIGGRDGFERMVDALHKVGMGLILDIVPNHMSTSLENLWWRDVIEHGESSHYSHYFDIDWKRPLTLPFLGDTFAAEVEKGALTLALSKHTGNPVFRYFENEYPLNPETYSGKAFSTFTSLDKSSLCTLHEAQSWRLMSWREAPRQLSWRRFFEITGLVGVRVEDPQVFDATHQLILELVHSGKVDGLRIDHVDGLADPESYLQQLRQATGPECYITVEKILAKGEQLPESWPVSGTTGYEFIASLAEVLVDDNNLETLEETHDVITGAGRDKKSEMRAAKALMVDRNFEGEFTTLLDITCELALAGQLQCDRDVFHHALREILIAFPVYRTYGTAEGLSSTDKQLVSQVIARIHAMSSSPEQRAMDFILQILCGDLTADQQPLATQFRIRFQQLTGPLMAKSVEDTLFFRHNVDLALNEVGADPIPRGFSISRFHQEMRIRLDKQPDGLVGTSTHDTKRGEDARARLFTLTEAPEQWEQNLERWRQMNQTHVRFLNDGTAPNAADNWMLYQALAGVWPPTLSVDDSRGLKELEERFIPFVEKALREAKLRTDWIDANEGYESVVLDYARNLLSPENKTFLTDFHKGLAPYIRAGLINSLSQTVIKLTAPGVPDIYQGSEFLNFSLVDPDNRREPDFALLKYCLEHATHELIFDQQAWYDGRLKQFVTTRLLHLRQKHQALFHYGDWVPLNMEGKRADNFIVYARTYDEKAVIIAVPRLSFDATSEMLPVNRHHLWQNVTLTLPESLTGKRYYNPFNNQYIFVDKTIPLDQIRGCLLVLVTGE